MEEILASIRRIISEDEAEPTPAAAAAPPPPAEEPVAAEEEPEPVFEEPEDDGELELTEKVESHGDLDVYSPAVEPEELDAETAGMGGLVSPPAAAAAAAAFGRLSGNMAMPAPGRTLEDVVRELLKPLLQQWLDENLPGIVQRAVDAEVQRIARGG
jgi:cell pole-organizing protein PopZ